MLGDFAALVYHLGMAITSSLSVGSPYAPSAVRAVSVRDVNSLARQIPDLAVPGVAVSIGPLAQAPLLYNPAGLLRSLGTVADAGALPAGAASGTGSAGLQGDLETVLGLNSDSGFLGGANPAGSLANLSANSRQALVSVLTAGQGSDAALQDLLAQSLAASNSGLDKARAAATVVDAAGILRSGSTEQTLKSLDSLRSANLGLAATAIDAGSGNTRNLGNIGLPGNTGATSDSQSFIRGQFARLEAAIADIDANRPRRRTQATAGADDLLLSGISLLTGVDDAAAIDAEPVLLADTLDRGPGVPANALARLAIDLPRHANPNSAAETAVAEFETELRASTENAPDSIRAEPFSSNELATRISRESATPQASGTVAIPAANATPTVTREPRYAEIAASMSMGAAVYRFQVKIANVVPPGAVDPLRTVLQVRSTQAVRKVE